MGYIALRHMRVCVLVLVIFNCLITVGWYSYIGYIYEQNKRYTDAPALVWADWALLVSAIVLFFTYIYSLRSKPRPGRSYKIIRTILLLIPTGFILGLRLTVIVLVIPDIRPGDQSPFDCAGSSDPDCYLANTQFWWSLITGFCVLFEMGMTVAWGPLERPHQGANVEFVSPNTPAAYYPQMQQQQGFYPQQPILLENSSYKIDQGVSPQQPYPQLYQQQPQQPYMPQQYQPQPFVPPLQQHQQQPQRSPQPSPQPSPGYVSQAAQYEMLQQQQLQQQQQQQYQAQQQHSFVQPAPYSPSTGY
ncbi:hypothetical protein BGZ95_004839 [Linnemannia exigua]|uniref:Uncharacterized protein n=1 Tax=Linnemannia exigua TaxID=604196 RepID=A0AAD4DHI9_9FUNG|nr:hypothetical protein BGZ95_004839 [Linnemannia exigua]